MNKNVLKTDNRAVAGKGLLQRFRDNQNGNFAVLAGFVLPTMVLGGVYGIDTYGRTMKSKRFDELVKNACYRAVKPPRTKILEDADRAKSAKMLVDAGIPKNEYDNIETNVSVNWLSVSVSAKASFNPVLSLAGTEPVVVKTQVNCQGIPPYPHDGEVVMSMQFTNSQGNALVLPNYHNDTNYCWGAYSHTLIDWNGSHRYPYLTDVRNPANIAKYSDGREVPGRIEIQFWGTPAGGYRSQCFGLYPALPSGVPSEYGIELDSYENNEIWKDIELHPGHYQLSVWYFPRPGYTTAPGISENVPDDLTNGIGIYVQGLRGTTPLPKSPVICMNGMVKNGWKQFTYNFRIDQYDIYRFFTKGEQYNDSVGGIFNSFELTYLNDLKTTKSYPQEQVVGKSIYSSYGECTNYLNSKYFKDNPSMTKWMKWLNI